MSRTSQMNENTSIMNPACFVAAAAAANKNTTTILLRPGSYGSDFKIAWKAAIEKKATAKST